MLNSTAQQIIKDTLNPWKFRLWCMKNLPSLSYWGVKVVELNEDRCVVSVPFKRQSKNPFKSIYFAAQAGAGEFSTGGLIVLHRAGKGSFSMLVVDSHMTFSKKASTTVHFTCDQGKEVKEVFDNLQVGESTQVILKTVGRDESGDVVSELSLTWSLLRKS
jgi:hypothetical protein